MTESKFNSKIFVSDIMLNHNFFHKFKLIGKDKCNYLMITLAIITNLSTSLNDNNINNTIENFLKINLFFTWQKHNLYKVVRRLINNVLDMVNFSLLETI